MPDTLGVSRNELEGLRKRAERLASEKTPPRRAYDLIAESGRTPGSENALESMARLICDMIGGSNVVISYRMDREFRSVDAHGKTRTTDTIDDDLGREAFETGRPVETAHDSRDVKMLTPGSTQAYAMAVPLIVGEDVLGVLKAEDVLMPAREVQEQLRAFFGYAALVLKNELHNYTRLSQAYDELNATNSRLTEEIGQRKKAEKELRKSKRRLEAKVLERTRVIETLSKSNQTLMHATDEKQLLHDICAVAVETGGYRMAWVGFVEHDEEKSIRPVAWAGAGADYLEHISVSWGTGPTGQGPSGRSIRERKPIVARDIEHDPRFAPWRTEAMRQGYRSSISLPLFDSDGTAFGAIAIYAERPDAFDAKEKSLLSELAGNLAYGVEALRVRRRRADAEERAREAARYARSLIETTINPLVTISPEGKITDVNKATEEATGIPRDRLIGTDFADYFTDPDRARAGYERVLKEGLVRDYPLALRNVSGSVMDVEYNASVYRNEAGELQGVFAAACDVTERKRAEMESALADRALKETTARLNEAQRIAHVGSWELDIVNNVLVWSDEIYRMFEVDPTKFDASYEAFLGAIHPEDRDAVDSAYADSVKTGTPYALDHRLLFPSGRVRYVHEECETTYDKEGNPIRSVGTVHDITERKRVETELEAHKRHLEDLVAERTADLTAANEQLAALNTALREATEAKSTFLSSMSHELRTPLNSIIGFSGVLGQGLAGPLTDEQRTQLGMISASGKHLLELINDVLDLAKVEAGKANIHVEPIDAAALVHAVADSVRPLATSKGLELAVDTQGTIGVLRSDASKVRQILFNLVGNAIKFTDTGRIEMNVRTGPNGEFSFVVSDTGCGIECEDLRRIFEAFIQIEKPEKTRPGGTGLGLKLSQDYATLLGGGLRVESEPGVGSVFTLTLPTVTPSPEGIDPVAAPG
ncbi:MAG: GAF domain-containing protein [Coriobacteriia bacterium]